MTNLINRIKTKKIDFPLIGVMFVAFVLRIINLGYSDFQGDEIKALFLPAASEGTFEFLFTQRKGPLQFLITFLIKFLDPHYTNQFLVRIPFALAGLLAVYFFYKLVKLHFGSRTALYAGFFLATNGFFVAFARIAQYQSFVILFSILSLYVLSLAGEHKKWEYKGVMWAAVFWALSLLSHYDGIFIAPALAFLGLKWLKRPDISKKHKRNTLIYAALTFLVLNLSFYIPFVLYISQGTKEYWLGRLTGDVSNKVSSSYYLFTVYQPIYVVHFYFALFAASLSAFLLTVLPKKVLGLFSKLPILRTVVNIAHDILHKILGLRKFTVVLIWFVIPLVFWEVLVYISGTHIYTYLLPLFIVLAVGIIFLEQVWDALTKRLRYIKPVMIKNVVIALFLIFISLQSYYVFVDNVKEYPWEEEKFLLWTMNVPTPVYHLSMFGFPYFRDWESIGRFIERHEEKVGFYSTNERESISRHYITLEKDTDMAGFYVYIRHPQSFTNDIPNKKVLYWASKYPPIYTLSKGGTDLVNIYLMEPGTLEEIQMKGL